jgi:quinol monooxygenase YgiN
MIARTAEFEIKPGKKQVVIEAIEKFTRTVHVSEPGSKLYVSFQDKKDENKFIHIMVFENEGAELKHKTAGYTQEFVDIVNKACVKKIIFKEFNFMGGL